MFSVYCLVHNKNSNGFANQFERSVFGLQQKLISKESTKMTSIQAVPNSTFIPVPLILQASYIFSVFQLYLKINGVLPVVFLLKTRFNAVQELLLVNFHGKTSRVFSLRSVSILWASHLQCSVYTLLLFFLSDHSLCRWYGHFLLLFSLVRGHKNYRDKYGHIVS